MSYHSSTETMFAVTVTLLVTSRTAAAAMEMAEWMVDDLEVREYQVEHAVEHRGLLSQAARRDSQAARQDRN